MIPTCSESTIKFASRIDLVNEMTLQWRTSTHTTHLVNLYRFYDGFFRFNIVQEISIKCMQFLRFKTNLNQLDSNAKVMVKPSNTNCDIENYKLGNDF